MRRFARPRSAVSSCSPRHERCLLSETRTCVLLSAVGGLCSKEPEPEPIPPVVIDTKCVTGAQVSADGLRVTGDPSGVFVGIAMSKIFGNDKGYFEVRLAKVADASKVFVGLGKRDAEVDKVLPWPLSSRSCASSAPACAESAPDRAGVHRGAAAKRKNGR
eukprot:COSAG02_NODE_5495_length_4282_cov_2.570165_2_plen_161_part_00